jgi:hypothetical protein
MVEYIRLNLFYLPLSLFSFLLKPVVCLLPYLDVQVIARCPISKFFPLSLQGVLRFSFGNLPPLCIWYSTDSISPKVNRIAFPCPQGTSLHALYRLQQQQHKIIK